MASIVNGISNILFSRFFTLNETHKLHSRVVVKSVGSENSVRAIPVPEPLRINGASSFDTKSTLVVSYDDGGKKGPRNVPEELQPLWDDGYGTRTMKDFVKTATDLIKSDGGPPRWFCPVACGAPIKDSPVLLYLPGLDGTGAGLTIHEKALGKVFHVQCLHIPVSDQTPLEGLIQTVEETVMIEHITSPDRPIYLLGDSFGGTLALAVATRNPKVDLVLILANPGDFVNMAMVEISDANHLSSLKQLFGNLVEDHPVLSIMTKILPKDTLTWRLKLVESAVAYVNSRLHAITAQVLILASGRDNFMPSKAEAHRFSRLLKHCKTRVFEGNGHTILLENGVNLLSVIKTTHMYRHYAKYDIFKDFLPTSMTEFKTSPMESWWYRIYIGAVAFSTMDDGKIVRGLAGIPDKGPVLVVGNHMLWGFDAFSVVLEFLREKKITLHGLAHPEIYQIRVGHELVMIPYTDAVKILGAVPVSPRNLFRLLSRNSYALLYPGGARESLHRKGEACKLFWPDKQEFVRMAVKLGATIIPFGGVGEDDLSELIIDYNDMKRVPFFDHMVKEYNQGRTNVRKGMRGEIAKQPLHTPIFLPKIPGRIYFLFGKPIQTKGKEHMSEDKDYLQELYMQIKCDVESNMAYLIRKREEDPYRGLDGTGAGLTIHEKALGKVFHVQCLHIPVSDQTPLEGLIQTVEEIVMIEHITSPDRPIYLLGDSFGGTLALAVATRNPKVDLVLILANPGDFVNMAMVEISDANHLSSLKQLFGNLVEDHPVLSIMTKILPKDTLTWRLKLVESAVAYVNSRLHAITAQVLILASGRDNFMPSKTEAHRFSRLLKHCKTRVFEGNGHTILLENGVNLLSVIKTTHMYRHYAKYDIFKDFLPTSMTEFKTSPMESWWYRIYIGAVAFSTMDDGKIVRGLAGIPDKGPVLVVGNHMLWGFDAFSVVLEFLREKKITLHGLAHPEIYQIRVGHELVMIPYTDAVKILGAVPVSPRNLFRLLSRNSYALLYPGGARESLHRKGEACKLFWPDKQEFVRMAVKLGATIIPFGGVGEDDLSELIIDYNDMKRVPFFDHMVKEYNQGRTNVSVPLSPLFNPNENYHRPQSRVLARRVGDDESIGTSGVVSCSNRKNAYYDVGGRKSGQLDVPEELKVFWDDGFGSQAIDDFAERAMDLIKSDGGPPRIFHVQCLHIPVWDRTPLEGLIQIVEETLMIEQIMSPNKPIYLLGESLGGALALAVAARNPTVDLILILANPATSYDKSPLRSLSSLVGDLPDEHYWMFPYAMSPLIGDYINIAMVKSYGRNLLESLWDLLAGFSKDLSLLSVVPKVLPKDTLIWKLKLVQSAATYANSRLHAITSQVLVLASGKDNVLPSINEARRLFGSLKHCDVRVFEANGHTILLESGVNLLTAIKTTHIYRRFSKHDILKDFLPISFTEFKNSPVEAWWFRLYIDAVMFSTMEDGKIVRGLAGIPDEGPVLIVGNHMLVAFDVFPIVAEFLREKKITLHGLTHPDFFHVNAEHEYYLIPFSDLLKMGGSIPVSGKNFFKLLANKSHVLLYPGGIREALHRKGETGKLFWPDKQEFVRMAVKFGATIIPYGGVGEDDILQLMIDYNDMKRNPILNHMVNRFNQGRTNLREGVGGEIGEQQFHIPLFLPKPPGRLYFKFGKPIRTKGKENMVDDADYLQELYMQIRCNVEENMAYLLKKRKEDPYRSIIQRLVWQLKHGSLAQIPSFEP
ncbi:hypothetical protein SSX86_012013 [Deinandra increscens subsp. villosa]|uniref:Serine aminopeptidase S33 domain-containing protein n=1 Tax=Deinandra increscens subsp. villosa TaxID=3103831 RepID=A0AAP0H142_9ASTR